MRVVDIHAHWYPAEWLKVFEKDGAREGASLERREGKYFLKAKQGAIYLPSLAVPHALKEQGIEQIVAPLPTVAGELSGEVGGFALILYPFLAAETGMRLGLSDRQWTELGAVLKRVHASQLPPDVVAGTRERYVQAFERITGAPFARYLQEDVIAP